MSRLTRDGGLPNPSREIKFLRRELGQGNINFAVQLTSSKIGNLTRLILSEIGSNLVSKHQNQPEYGGEQTDAGRDD